MLVKTYRTLLIFKIISLCIGFIILGRIYLQSSNINSGSRHIVLIDTHISSGQIDEIITHLSTNYPSDQIGIIINSTGPHRLIPPSYDHIAIQGSAFKLLALQDIQPSNINKLIQFADGYNQGADQLWTIDDGERKKLGPSISLPSYQSKNRHLLIAILFILLGL